MKRYKKILFIGLICTIISIGYYYNFSLSSFLHDYGFSTKNIIHSEEITQNDGPLVKVLLLTDGENLGVLTAKRNKLWMWSNFATGTYLSSPSSHEYASAIVVTNNDLPFGEKPLFDYHIFVATFLEDKSAISIPSPDDFSLQVQSFEIKGKTLLYAQAKNSKEKPELTSNDVIKLFNN
ncbi:hypothetical protein [Bacillus alkalisoli]|uniref:hypothetical protein n=1 Tax=Bacillus alkalisoli TaxID=2011008 RepID=UPI000C24CED5|nr:hypothetical protein [Bacillus alkalisoli]